MRDELSSNIKEVFSDKFTKMQSIKGISIVPIYEGCKQMARVREVGGSVGYGIRSCAASIIKFTTEQDYSILWANDELPDVIEEQVSHIITAPISNDPSTCERFESNNPGGCSGCQFKGKIKSPIRIGTNPEPSQKQTETNTDSADTITLVTNLFKYLKLAKPDTSDETPNIVIPYVKEFSGYTEVSGFSPISKVVDIDDFLDFNLWEFAPFNDVWWKTQDENNVIPIGSDTPTNVVFKSCVKSVMYDETNGEFCGELWFATTLYINGDAKPILAIFESGPNGKIKLLNLKREDHDIVTKYVVDNEVLMFILRTYQRCLLTIHSGCEAKLCRITDKQKTINKKRVAKGKKPLYEETLIKIKPSVYYKPTATKRYTPTCAHQRRGHFRTLQSGKKVWVRDCKVSEGHERSVKHNYLFEYETV